MTSNIIEKATHWTESEPVRLAAHRAGRVYLAGPMTGLPDLNFPAFNAEAANLRAQGLTVINPAEHGIVEGAEWADYLRHDLAGLMSCERIHLLQGWQDSKGARLEVHAAKALGMHITYQDGAILAMRPHADIDPARFAHGHNGDSITIYMDGQPVHWVPVEALTQALATTEPIPMVLHCPKCGVQHIDEAEDERTEKICHGPKVVDEVIVGWNNPPHRSHLCHGCGTIWRPADVPTTGVAAINTKGKADTWAPGQPATPERKGEPVAWMNDEGDMELSHKPWMSSVWKPLYTSPQVPEDTERLDWIEHQHLEELTMGLAIDCEHDGQYYVCGDSNKTGYGDTLREAIDAARKGE